MDRIRRGFCTFAKTTNYYQILGVEENSKLEVSPKEFKTSII